MPTIWKHRCFVFVPMGILAAGNQAAADWDPDTGGALTFGDVRLSSSGNEPATWTGCNSAATDQMKADIDQKIGLLPPAKVYWASDGWTWQTALVDRNLQVIVAPL